MILQLNDDKEDSFNETLVTSDMRDFGNSLVLVKDGNQVKIHIHTLKPESVMSYFHKFGEFIKLKIENMTVQHNETVFAGKKDVADTSPNEPFRFPCRLPPNPCADPV